MHIVSCFKVVPEEQDIVVTPDQKLSFDRADFKISQFDLNGIEAAVQLAGEGDVVTALSVGGKILENSKLKKDVLSRGPSELCLVKMTLRLKARLLKRPPRRLPPPPARPVLICWCSVKAPATSTLSRPVFWPPVCSACPV